MPLMEKPRDPLDAGTNTSHTISGTGWHGALGRGGCQYEFLNCWQGRSYSHLGPHPTTTTTTKGQQV